MAVAEENGVLVTIYTQVYNTRDYIRQCVESVLNQTCPRLEYYLIDNGSTDGCKEILEEYARADRRVRLIRHEENAIPPPGLRVMLANAAGQYYATLDSDDWWEPDYLEKLLGFMERNRLDIACTGTVMHVMSTGQQRVLRRREEPLLLPRAAFAEGLPLYHAFFRPVWGKLVRMSCMRSVRADLIPPLFYGYDTAWCFQLLRRANRVGIDSSVLHHYRLFEKSRASLSYQYDPGRFAADIYLYRDVLDFLTGFGPVSGQNRSFLQCVHANAVMDTANVIDGSTLSPPGKLREYRTVAEHPLTLAAYRECADESAAMSRGGLMVKALEAGAALKGREDSDLRALAQALLPRCGRAVSAANARMFLEDAALLRALLQDDRDAVMEALLNRAEQNRDVKRHAIPETLQALAVDDPLLCRIDDPAFLREHGEIYRALWRGQRAGTLEKMAGLLLEDRAGGGRETFLRLFISLAALEDQAPAFIFGKLRLAELCMEQGRREECREMVEELSELGLEGEELSGLRRDLEKGG